MLFKAPKLNRWHDSNVHMVPIYFETIIVNFYECDYFLTFLVQYKPERSFLVSRCDVTVHRSRTGSEEHGSVSFWKVESLHFTNENLCLVALTRNKEELSLLTHVLDSFRTSFHCSAKDFMVDKGQFFSQPSILGKKWNRILYYFDNQGGIHDPRGAEIFVISLVTLLMLMF